MSPEDFLYVCTLIALGILAIAFLVITLRIIKGPTLPDRVLGLDMLVAAVIGFIAVLAIKSGFYLYLDIAIALALVGFLATVAFARFIIRRERLETPSQHAPLKDERTTPVLTPTSEPSKLPKQEAS
ncbi:MAG: cation:proton antiporter [Pseudomonadota bacterium]